MIAINCVAALALGVLAAQPAAPEASLKSQKEKVSYSIGVDMGKSFKRMGAEIDAETMARGLRDGLAGEKLLMSDQEMQSVINAFRTEMMQKQAEVRKAAGDESKTAGAKFLAENKTKKGVVTLPSGLQYKVLKAAEGKKPTAADTVECHYRGTLLDGTEFDSSYRRGKPFSLQVSGVIEGWQEALKLMPVGSKWQLFVPAELAYGAEGRGPQIPPNATLVFEIELVSIK